MSDPPRLLEQSSTAASTRELLRALEPPQPAPPALQAALVKDLSGLVAGSSLKAAGLTLWAKASLLGALALGAGGAVYVASSNKPQAAAATPVASAKVAAPAVSAAVPHPLETEAPVGPASATPSEKPKSALPSTPRDSLAEEEALLEAARSVSASNPTRALSLLRKHQAQFPNGQLGAERLYLTVDCLQRVGNVSGAKREAAALLKSYPNSAYARRVQQLLPASPLP